MPKTYRRHNCRRQHRTWRTLAGCIWPRAAWITGDGPYASVAYCRVTTVCLFADLDKATEAKQVIDSGGCGGLCGRRHEVIQLIRTEPIP